MQSATLWRRAPRPNYTTNVDLLFPYSEVAHLGQYELVRIPHSLNDLIAHLDYWGEGSSLTARGFSGFTNSYNVNTQYRLVSAGADRDRKIPNRIPVVSLQQCDTSPYVRGASVLLATAPAARCSRSTVDDIARVINPDLGLVVAHGSADSFPDRQYIESALAAQKLFLCPGYELPTELSELAQFKTYSAFVGLATAKDHLLKYINDEKFDFAARLTKTLNNNVVGNEAIESVVQTLLNAEDLESRERLMKYAWKLNEAQIWSAVKTYFPSEFNLIFSQLETIIINKRYSQAIFLEEKDDNLSMTEGWGDSLDKDSIRVQWRLFPEWWHGKLRFKLYNIYYNMFLCSDTQTDKDGDRRAHGQDPAVTDDRYTYYLEPFIENNYLYFYIINYEYNEGLKLTLDRNRDGNRRLFGHGGDIRAGEDRFKWRLVAASDKTHAAATMAL
ncbi:microvitellogenin-like [Anticarsia gemmatalis]|uniref:microvitellogenin-like n=1 Tax=Anticarsia gemmatalis TaxID=129554 RepID=UPI003F768A50